MTEKKSLSIILSNPRGFCAGVHRAVQIVEKAIDKYGSPVYVRHEIVHNKTVVENLQKKGAIFVDELDEIPDNTRPVIFSAHGVPKSVPQKASERGMIFVNAMCPLVGKVHKEAIRHHENGLHIILIGHEGHPEVVGTMGQLPESSITLVETTEQAEALTLENTDKLAFITQTTLSVDDAQKIIEVLMRRFPNMESPPQKDICYATTNRQAATKEIAPKCDAFLVIGAPNSSNSVRLVEVAKSAGCPTSKLAQNVTEIDWNWLEGVKTLGISAGASAPEILVHEILDALKERFDVKIEEVHVVEENIQFNLPRELRDA
ncbi:MAG: 4-hydroxy-3-methylbut-2-enyl diphosphate reductase [Alphaproteobacteria bacterium]